jgi:tetratricopeptide (TPR) repeat protein
MAPDSTASDEIQRFEEQYRRQPESLVFARLADAYRKAGQPERALSVLEDGLLRHPEYPSGHIVRARALRDLGRVDETLQSFRRVLELDGANLVAIRELAGLADERGDVDESRHWYERLAHIEPTNLEVQARLAELEASAPEPAWPEPELDEPDGGDEPAAEGPHEWWDDSAVTGPSANRAVDEPAPTDDIESGRRPEDEVVEAILNGDVPHTVRAEDTWWYEESPAEEEPEPSRDADLLTRTMADLYAEQGLHREASEIYEELLRDAPGDPDLIARLEALRAAAAPKTDSGHGPPEEEGSPTGAEPAVETEAVDDPGDSTEPLPPSIGTPWVDELRQVLRAGEESAATLPEPEESASAAEEESVAEGPPGDGPEPSPLGADSMSPFARKWIRGLETDS